MPATNPQKKVKKVKKANSKKDEKGKSQASSIPRTEERVNTQENPEMLPATDVQCLVNKTEGPSSVTARIWTDVRDRALPIRPKHRKKRIYSLPSVFPKIGYTTLSKSGYTRQHGVEPGKHHGLRDPQEDQEEEQFQEKEDGANMSASETSSESQRALSGETAEPDIDEQVVSEENCDATVDKGKGKEHLSAVCGNEALSNDEPQPPTHLWPTQKAFRISQEEFKLCLEEHEALKAPGSRERKYPKKPFTPSPSRQNGFLEKEETALIRQGRPDTAQDRTGGIVDPQRLSPNSLDSASISTDWTIVSNPSSRPSPNTTIDLGKGRTMYCNPHPMEPNRVLPLGLRIDTHAHPSSSPSNRSCGPPQKGRDKEAALSRKSGGLYGDLDCHNIACEMSKCDKYCNLWDGATVVCPRCGPYSTTRYCSTEHLFADIKQHWGVCGQAVFKHPCNKSSIPIEVRDGVPLIPCLHRYDAPERGRQAVYFNMNARKGDYFIFSDWLDQVDAGFPKDDIALTCSSRLIHVVEFTDPKKKDRFRRVLAACLFFTLEAHELVDYLFRLIRDSLRASNSLTTPLSVLESSLKYQVHREFAVTIQPRITGERHACPTDWSGANRRHCNDTVCRSEITRLLGSLGNRGQEALLKSLEGSYWILRAARTTHPNVKDFWARMKGEGFEDVPKEDRKVFCRGHGWDGIEVGDGEMDIEGINA